MDESQKNPDHLFISYAYEDLALAEWLTFKLTGVGYKVWCDRVKLFGGESFPNEIDDAIKNRAFRLLALLSRYSRHKPNPVKERTLALNIAREREIDFMIPLNLGLKPTDLTWMVSDLTYIDFSQNWASGLSHLLKALDKAATPCPLSDGKLRVANSVIPKELTKGGTETIFSNIYRIVQIPAAVQTFVINSELRAEDWKVLRQEWPSYKIGSSTFIAFMTPSPDLCDRFGLRFDLKSDWRYRERICGVESSNIVSNLIRSSLVFQFLQKGLVFNREYKWLHFPMGMLKRNRITVSIPGQKKTWVLAAGERNHFSPGKKKEKYQYHLSPAILIRQDLGDDFTVRLNIRVHIGDSGGNTLPDLPARSRRKAVARDWWNREWLMRNLGVFQFLSDGEDEIVVGDIPNERLVISAYPTTYISEVVLDEKEIEGRRRARKALAAGDESTRGTTYAV